MARHGSPPATHPTARLLGDSAEIVRLRAHIRHLSSFDTLGNPHVPTLLIHGETGTGKGLLARIVHDSGPRAAGPFIAVNCSAIPESLLEAELFGFEAGAFTDAKRDKPGLFEAACGGTLFLDEIDALPVLLQSKLLTAVEEKQVRRLGTTVSRGVDVKLVVATQADLQASVSAGRFRADLYHRLAVIVITVPPLRQRGDDVVLLARHFLRHYASAHGVGPKRLSTAAEAWLLSHRWPGNVHELSHVMERLTLLCPDEALDPPALEQWSASEMRPTALPQPEPVDHPQEPVDEPERIRQALLRTGGNITRAARVLGYSRKALRYRLQRYGISRPGLEASPPPPHLATAQGAHPSSSSVRQGKSRTGLDAPPTPLEGKGADVGGDVVEAGAAASDALERFSGWQQRTVAVLAIDLTLPMTSGMAVAPAESWAATRRWEQSIAEVIQKFGGIFLRRTPPLLVAGFGLPQSLEQMPHRAVQAALAIRHLADETRSVAGAELDLEVRQAVHLGPVLADAGVHAPVMRLPAVGNTLALPMRLLGHAAPGEILISRPAARLVEGAFALQARELLLGMGKTDQVTAYTVVGLRALPGPLGSAEVRSRSRFVGRGGEMAILHDLLADVEGTRGQVVGIVGEPGMGKSRLLREFQQQLTGRPLTYLAGSCFAYGRMTPYLPVLEILRQYCEITEVDPVETVIVKVRCCLHAAGMDPDAGAPYLLHALGMRQGVEQVAGLTPQTVKARTFDALCQLSLRASHQRPLVLSIEDIHWLDDTSVEYVTSLVERLAAAAVLLLCTYRPGYMPPWMGKSYATRLTLKPLAAEDSHTVVRSALPTGQVPDGWMQAILAKAEGNPFFLEELVHAVSQQRELHPHLELPETIQGALMARIDSLSEAPKHLLQTLAVVGNPCPMSLLRYVMEKPVDTLQRLLSTLQREELLYEQPAIPEPKYLLKHALAQEVAYYALPVERRRTLHERIAHGIEALYEDRLEGHYGDLAHHYRYSGNIERAVVCLQASGQRAARQSALKEAIDHLCTAVELLQTLPDTPQRARIELDLQLELGPAFMATEGPGSIEVEQAYRRASELCQRLGETPQLFPALLGLWRHYQLRAEQETARALGERLLHLAQRQDDVVPLMVAHRALGQTLFFLGELAAARVHLEQGLALYTPQHHPPATRYGTDPGIPCLYYAAHTLWLLGFPERAREHIHTMLRLARGGTDLFSLGSALFYAARLSMLRREVEAAREHVEELMRLSAAQGFHSLRVYGMILRGSVLIMSGEREAGMADMHQGLEAHRGVGTEAIRPMLLALLAAAYESDGPATEGLRVVDEALLLVEKYGVCYYEAELHRLKGSLLLRHAGSEAYDAESCFSQALEVARRQQAKAWELRAAISLARLWQRQGKIAEGHTLLVDTCSRFTEGFDTPDFREAKMLFDACS